METKTTTKIVAGIRPKARRAAELIEGVLGDLSRLDPKRCPEYVRGQLAFARNVLCDPRDDFHGLAVASADSVRDRGGYMRTASDGLGNLRGVLAALRPCLWPVVAWEDGEARKIMEDAIGRLGEAFDVAAQVELTAARHLSPDQVERRPPRNGHAVGRPKPLFIAGRNGQ